MVPTSALVLEALAWLVLVVFEVMTQNLAQALMTRFVSIRQVCR